MQTTNGFTKDNWKERVSPRSSAFIIVDMQKEFLSRKDEDGRPLLRTAEQIGKVATMARKVGVPVIYTRQTNLPGALTDVPFFRVRWGLRTHCLKSSWGWEIIDELAPQPGDLVVDKHRSSAFVGTDLQLLLHNLGIWSLVLSGTSTKGCLLYTALNAVDYGYYVTVLADCATGSTVEGHKHGMWILEQHTEIRYSDRLIALWAEHLETIGKGTVQCRA